MTNLKCIILFYMNDNPRIFIIINSIYLFIYLFTLLMRKIFIFFLDSAALRSKKLLRRTCNEDYQFTCLDVV